MRERYYSDLDFCRDVYKPPVNSRRNGPVVVVRSTTPAAAPFLVDNCAWCNPDRQQALPGFGITDGICYEDKLLVFLKTGYLEAYLQREGMTALGLLAKYIEKAKVCKAGGCARAKE